MKQLYALTIGDDVRAAVARVVDRIGPVRTIAAGGWQGLVDQCRVDPATNTGSAPLVFGPLAFVLKHAAVAEIPFGFVMPVAQNSKPWQRSSSWRDDATIELWHAGWSPQAIDRILVPTNDAVVEFAIGDVRRIPLVTGQPQDSTLS